MCANCSWAADRQAQRCTDLLHRVEHRGPDTGLVGLDAADRSQGDRDEDQTQAEGHHQDPGQHITEVSRVGIQLGEPEHSAGTKQSPNAGDPPRSIRDTSTDAVWVATMMPALNGRKANPDLSGL